ncbi:MAG: prepilin-type N-terminal cleavage/methylation domain-containing protein [Gammaproteobacteria bacterium]|nr:prepilin-type N-terminal cleavage/methylation domain-containing protein [Gammaproteobacteria bacterium]
MNSKVAHGVCGFTLIELMVAVSIVGVLITISIGSYQYYILNAKVTEAVLFQGKLRTDFNIAYQVNKEFPMKLGDSTAWTATKQANKKKNRKDRTKIKLSDHRIKMPDSELIDEYWYDYNPKKGQAWIAIGFSEEAFPDCGGECAVHIGYQLSRSGDLYEFCGRWTGSEYWGKFPLSMMPPSCNEECVSCEMRKASKM